MSESFRLSGDPSSIRASAREWQTFADAASSASGDIKSLDTAEFVGDEAETYQDQISSDLPTHLDTASQAWGIVARALHAYAGELEDYQSKMSALSTKASNQQQAVSHQQSQVSNAKAADLAHTTSVAQAKATLKPGDTLPADTYRSQTSSAQSNLTNAQQALQSTYDAASKIRTDHSAAVQRCRHEIDRAKDMRFAKPPGFWGRLKDSVCGWISDHAGVLLQISSVLKTISGIAGLIALIPIPGLQEVAAGVALATGGAALLIDVGVKLATGQGSWAQIGIEALSMIPGAKAAMFAGVASTAYTGYEVSQGKASWGDLAMSVGMTALSFKGGMHGGSGSNESGPKFGGGSDHESLPPRKTSGPSEPEFLGMPTHVRTTGTNGVTENRVLLPTRPGESMSVTTDHGSTITATRTPTGHQVTVLTPGEPTTFTTHLPDGSDVHFGDGSAPGTAPRSPSADLGTHRSTQPYSSNGVRVSRDAGQNQMAETMVNDMGNAGMGPRVDQGQVTSTGMHSNRPDVSGVLNGTQPVHSEFDRVGSAGGPGPRVAGHVNTILGHDPTSIVITVPSP